MAGGRVVVSGVERKGAQDASDKENAQDKVFLDEVSAPFERIDGCT
jgi:hypothetical protein